MTTRHILTALLGAMLLALAVLRPALAVDPEERLTDPALEARARALTRDLRCVVCQNQSVDDSDAPLAKDIRVLVRERIAAGESDDQVRDFIVARYGKFVLLRPPFDYDTALLWLGPALVFVMAAAGTAFYIRRQARQGAAPVPLSAEEEAQVRARLEGGGT